MGEYEPKDSRNVTQKPGNVPGEPPRTGPREDQSRDEAREKAREDDAKKDDPREAGPREQQRILRPQRGKMIDQVQQQGRQFQSQGKSVPQTAGGPSSHPSTEEQARSEASPGRLNEDIEDGPLAGDQPQAIDNRPGDPRPTYDQYETNSPQNMHQERQANEAELKRQAEAQNDSSLDKGLGYAVQDGEEMSGAPDVTRPDNGPDDNGRDDNGRDED